MKLIIAIIIILVSFVGYGQSKTEKWEKQYAKKADDLFKSKNYSAAQVEYGHAYMANYNVFYKKMADSCMRFSRKLSDDRQLIIQANYRNKLKSDSSENRRWRDKHDSIAESKRPKLSEEDKAYYKLEAQISSLTPRGLTTPFCNYKYNFVTVKIQNYIKNYMNMSLIDDNEPFKINILTDFYSGSKTKLKFTYNVMDDGREYVIKGCKITGDRISLISFFIDYWPTKLTIDDKKPIGVYTCQFLEDVINLHLNGQNSYIEITKIK